jgi:hypothetical protein
MAMALRLLRNIFVAPRARVLGERPLAGGGYRAVLEVTGLLCGRL